MDNKSNAFLETESVGRLMGRYARFRCADLSDLCRDNCLYLPYLGERAALWKNSLCKMTI